MLSQLPGIRRTAKGRGAPAVSAPPSTTVGDAPTEDARRLHERDLIDRARAGDHAAVAELYDAHQPVALGIARRLCRPSDVDDVVSEAFTKVLDQIARGAGPRVSFRAYLITAVRSAAADVGRAQSRLLPTDAVEDLGVDDEGPLGDQPHSSLRTDSELLARALSTLPSRWQLALWWTTVEGRPLAEVGDELGLNANAVAALTFRARQGLRDAYLDLHVSRSADPACDALRSDFPAFARDRLDASPTAVIGAHLLDCEACREVIAELRSMLAAGAAR
ncbi:sigma-70 family RNA polymerase sigma factor [Nocardioides sp. 503]|uniref:RNA polymerase sigma factor n=1 Tax=Nocardioides sp. 503 TaxID=2508326 RepID=UPI00106F1428|nr:sigma-70 family RNA polymerase sigma factor [Nocardioides sp. 503]